jgi:hypothetical protein
MRLTGGPFTGIAPIYADHVLPNNAATIAKNCLTNSGELRPLGAPLFNWTPTKTGTIKTIWRYLELYWFHWVDDVDVVSTPLANDPHQRVYWTGETEPRMTTYTLGAVGAGTNYPLNWYQLGIPAPINAPTTSHGANSDPNNVQSRAYIYTYVSAIGEEGPPSPVSALTDITDGDTMGVYLTDAGPIGGNYNITAKNLYRLNEGVYQFVIQLPVAQITYLDEFLNIYLGDGITSTEYDPPPADLKGLIKMPGGFLAGFIDGYVCLSEPYLPHAWPVRYRVPFTGTIVSIQGFNNSVLVMVRDEKPYLLTGNDPGSMTKEQFEIGYGDTSKRATVDMGISTMYPCSDGIIIAGAGVSDNATKSIIDPRLWAPFAPDLAAKYGEHYIFFTATTGYILNVKTGDLSTTDIVPTAVYTDPGTGDMFMVVDGDIVQFDAGPALTGEWQSKRFMLGRSTNFSRARVRADDYPVTVHFYGDSKLLHSRNFVSKEITTLPGNGLYDEFQYKIIFNNPVKFVTIGNSAGEV